VKLASKFFSNMQEHVDDNSIPRDVPAFARSFFSKATRGGFTLAPKVNDAKKPSTTQPADGTGGGKRKPNGKEQQGQKKPKKEFLDKSLKMGLFHVKKGTPASKALPDKSTLKDGAGICMDFCSHERKCTYPHQLCKNGKHCTNWKNVPDEDKITLLKHMNSLGLMWLDAKTFEKHKIVIAPKFAHLLGDSMGPKQKAGKSM
jgi:hypothetical protein